MLRDAVRDTFWRGDLTVWQPRRGQGYRFNIDPVLLAGSCASGRHILDLGAGCGILGLLLLAMDKAERVTAVEVQPDLAEMAARNAQDNGLQARLHVVCCDLRELPATPADGVLFNPPYFRAGEGRACQAPGRELARREHRGTLTDFAACAAMNVTDPGRVAAIVRASRGAELAHSLRGLGLPHTGLTAVRPRPGEAALHTIVHASRAPLTFATSDLVVHAATGRAFSPEVEALLSTRTAGGRHFLATLAKPVTARAPTPSQGSHAS